MSSSWGIGNYCAVSFACENVGHYELTLVSLESSIVSPTEGLLICCFSCLLVYSKTDSNFMANKKNNILFFICWLIGNFSFSLSSGALGYLQGPNSLLLSSWLLVTLLQERAAGDFGQGLHLSSSVASPYHYLGLLAEWGMGSTKQCSEWVLAKLYHVKTQTSKMHSGILATFNFSKEFVGKEYRRGSK